MKLNICSFVLWVIGFSSSVHCLFISGFLLLGCYHFLFYLYELFIQGINNLPFIYVANIFSQTNACLFISVFVIFHPTDILIFIFMLLYSLIIYILYLSYFNILKAKFYIHIYFICILNSPLGNTFLKNYETLFSPFYVIITAEFQKIILKEFFRLITGLKTFLR